MQIYLSGEPDGQWAVQVGESYDRHLTFDEALGVVASAMLTGKFRYLRSHEAWQAASGARMERGHTDTLYHEEANLGPPIQFPEDTQPKESP